MSFYSSSSKEKLDTCDAAIMRLFYKVDENYPHTIIYGYRTPEEQFEIFKYGREEINGYWIIKDKSKIRTYKDGFVRSSDHNCYPSLAVDAMPDPVDWDNIPKIKEFAAYVKGFAMNLNIPILWGGDWPNFKDYAHWYLKK